jgi:ribonuclease-3 family protein
MDKNIEKEFFENTIKHNFNKKISANEYSPLVLAYIGDAIYEVYVRTMIISKGNTAVNNMHKEAKKYVKASEQARIYHTIEAILTESEMSVFKRGRNAKSFTVPKNAVLSDYKHATGLEALVGYLYIDGQLERLMELLDKGIQALESNE